MNTYSDLSIAVMIPCYNEELTIGAVLSDFHAELPEAKIYVGDNCCTDNTVDIAQEAGAIVISEPRPGKGFMIATMMRKIEADIYIMIDGDDTYPVDQVHNLLRPVLDGLTDMCVGSRLNSIHDNSFRRFHHFGNKLVARTINIIFDSDLSDVMSGFRAFNRYFVKSIPLLSRGFEIETQMSLQALYYQFKIFEVPVVMRERPENSFSKLRTFRDGANVILAIVNAFKAYRPLLCFSLLSAFLLFAALVCRSYQHVSLAFTIGAFFTASCGLILDTTNHRLREIAKLIMLDSSHYQSYKHRSK